ncbi:MAG: thioesterase [Methylobacter sp.]|nr:MAG: thioesterase [Methylobacter sp.]PPD03629.1 MAG: thioesterase [Methylobacter sp.]PPD22183.1 MAG: thioesterase [Methylobacter sp.]PPD34853.1 MAG: thioesterase [Methylomonas sp.]
MDVTQLPFNQLIGLTPADEASGFLVGISDDPNYTNHLGSVHASALLALAEAGSGEFLARRFSGHADAVPVVRRLEARFRKPGVGKMMARCTATDEAVTGWADELSKRGRVSAVLAMEVVDQTGAVVMTASVEWFIRLSK